MLKKCCGGLVIILGNACVCGNLLAIVSLGKKSKVCGQLGQELREGGSPYRGNIGYLPWLLSCRLFQLNPGPQGEHLTSQLPDYYSCMFALSIKRW